MGCHHRQISAQLMKGAIQRLLQVYRWICCQDDVHVYRLADLRLQAFCKEQIISVQDFERNPMNIFMAHETFAQVDGISVY